MSNEIANAVMRPALDMAVPAVTDATMILGKSITKAVVNATSRTAGVAARAIGEAAMKGMIIGVTGAAAFGTAIGLVEAGNAVANWWNTPSAKPEPAVKAAEKVAKAAAKVAEAATEVKEKAEAAKDAAEAKPKVAALHAAKAPRKSTKTPTAKKMPAKAA
jgi:hypothetical protein